MPRKGDRKVRTGCKTCKARKVKCDEVKPHCFRCTSTGRKCDGYAQPKPPAWMKPPLISTSLNSTNYKGGLARHLEYYHYVAGPGLAGQFSEKFWTKFLPQLGERESAVRHAIMAISMAYEDRSGVQSSAINHYNTAIRETVSSTDTELAMVMAVLFTCLEFMNGNAAAARNHSQHAILIANKTSAMSEETRDALLSIFARLSVFPFFFGSDHEDFPKLRTLEGPLTASPFPGINEAHPALEVLIAQIIRFMRSTDKYRLGEKRTSRIPLTMFAEQNRLSVALDTWRKAFDTFEKSLGGAQLGNRHLGLLRIIHCISKIWIRTTLERSECAYDKHNAQFASIIACAQELKREYEKIPYEYIRPKFSFDMGFLPLLYFVVLKCRVLELRLAALECMQVLGLEQEALWRKDTLTIIGRKLIDIEHGVDSMSQAELCSDALPAEEQRVKECMLDPATNTMTCVMWRPPDELYTRDVTIEGHMKSTTLSGVMP